MADAPQTTPLPTTARIALELAAGAAAGAIEDLDQMKRFHPPSKRGTNYTRHLESLERRLAAIESGAREALAHGR